jgi:DNA-directed RNA polymerase III subunit RPC1
MGVSIKSDVCSTCGLPLQTCNGHFGNIKLVLPVYHVGYFKKVIQILQSICKARSNTGTSRNNALTYCRIALVSFSQKSIGADS